MMTQWQSQKTAISMTVRGFPRWSQFNRKAKDNDASANAGDRTHRRLARSVSPQLGLHLGWGLNDSFSYLYGGVSRH